MCQPATIRGCDLGSFSRTYVMTRFLYPSVLRRFLLCGPRCGGVREPVAPLILHVLTSTVKFTQPGVCALSSYHMLMGDTTTASWLDLR